ncbi:MAG: ABC transporter ATP-binding protein [Synechococcaceae cyanobacterium SM2_3_1]|nr:ABC transporter ATP-binding protein [Synechococcaceae cyanobacterium SM2_3_1]
MIEVQGLTFTYKGSPTPAVDAASFHVQAGEIFGFLGPSGAGKSTTQKILTGLLRGYQGTIQILGKDLRAWGADYYEHIGVSFELPNHYQRLSALENLNFFRSLYSGATEDPSDLLDKVGLGEDAHRRVSQFSKGMQMRLTFVRTLLNQPQLIFLDEPTSGLDPGYARVIKEWIRQLQQEGRTIFLTSHDMTVVDELCDRVAFIVDGRIVLIEAPRALKLQQGERRVRVEYHAHGDLKRSEFPLEQLGQNQAFLALLREQAVETIHSTEATLEDIFIQVTGRTLE